MLDSIVEFLYGETETLRQCCLVSKSWVPRTRKHLFALIMFPRPDAIEKWKRAFPDQSNSPAHYTHTLVVSCPRAITPEYAAEGGLISTFSRLVRLEVNKSTDPGPGPDLEMNLTPFYKIPATLKSLSVATPFALPLSQVFNLIRFLPSLEDLSLIGEEVETNDNDPDDLCGIVPSPTSPAFTGVLYLYMFRGIGGTARRLVNLPNGLHFWRLQLKWYGREDIRYVVDLVTACSGTLELLELTYIPEDGSSPGRIDLSKATKLQYIEFRCRSLGVGWIAATLETITPEHRGLEQITIDVGRIIDVIKHNPGMGWPDLDHLLVRFWESCSVWTTFECTKPPNRAGGIAGLAMWLLPELTGKGIIDLVDEPIWYS